MCCLLLTEFLTFWFEILAGWEDVVAVVMCLFPTYGVLSRASWATCLLTGMSALCWVLLKGQRPAP